AVAAAGLWDVLIAWSRLVLGYHWLSDTIGGILLAIAVLTSAGAAMHARWVPPWGWLRRIILPAPAGPPAPTRPPPTRPPPTWPPPAGPLPTRPPPGGLPPGGLPPADHSPPTAPLTLWGRPLR
ncbi:MAG: phosphatase PAP2 family protein, partial [Frankiaceae bacterium]|nr:phosphatase PAP2 family protein [Frankiaceae bacterium]